MRLADLLKYSEIIIQAHDNPDPDAIAAGFGLYTYFSKMGKKVRFIYSGRRQIQKTNIVLLVKELNIPVEYIDPLVDITFNKKGLLLLTVDCQYGAGNVTKFAATKVAIIDHHQEEVTDVELSEIRPNYGSCSTLVWRMMKDAGFDFEGQTDIGTALYYGLYSDTNQFGEIRNAVDMDMRDSLDFSAHIVNMLRNSNISLKELETAGIALIRYIYNDVYRYAIIKSQPCDPNILGLISDLVLQVDCVDTCVVYNETDDGIKLSVRSCTREVKASELAAFLTLDVGSGGGHLEKAGGFIQKSLYEKYYKTLHAEAFFSEKLNDYFDNSEVIYADRYEMDTTGLKKYVKRKIPIGYADVDDIFPAGTPLLIRTLEGDFELTHNGEFYVMIGIKGDVYPIKKETFNKGYIQSDEPFAIDVEYSPTIKNMHSGKTENVLKYAKSCVSSGMTYIYARQISKRTKVFTAWDPEKYMFGRAGDYLAVRCDNPHDIYIVEQEIFSKTYDELSE